MPFELNSTLRDIVNNLCPPWTEMSPGREPTAPFGYESDTGRSQAPTRQQSIEPSGHIRSQSIEPSGHIRSQSIKPSGQTRNQSIEPEQIIENKKAQEDEWGYKRLPSIPEATEELPAEKKNKKEKKEEHRFQYFNNNKRSSAQQKTRQEDKRGRPKARSLSPSGRISAHNYAAVEVNKAYGLIDDGCQGGMQLLILHAPRDTARMLSVRQGDWIQALSTLHGGGLALLRVLFITRTQYFKPGRKLTSIAVGVPKDEWDMLQVRRQRFVQTL